MRTRNRILPVLLLVLAVFTLAALTAPGARARMLPPVPRVIVDPGDPDEPIDARGSAVSPSSGNLMRRADGPSQICAPRASVLEADNASGVAPHKGDWRVRDILIYVLFRSSVLR